MLQPLQLPPYPFKITEHNGILTLFDEIRKKHIIITPEEWVRQHFVQYLINQKNYPARDIMMSVAGLLAGNLKQNPGHFRNLL